MTRTILTLLLLCATVLGASAQLNLPVLSMGEYLGSGMVKPWSTFEFGSKAEALQPGTAFDLVTEEGHRFTFTVEKRETQYVPDGHVRIYAKTPMQLDALNSSNPKKWYAVSPGKPYPGATITPVDLVVPQEAPAATADFTAQLNGNEWSAGSFYQSALFYEGGIKMLDETGNPYLQLAFKSTQAPDDRQLTFVIRNFKGTGKYPGMEVLLSGSADGVPANSQMCGYQDNPAVPAQKTNFVLEITDFTRVSDETAYISGHCSGKLKGVLGSQDVEVVNGTFQKVEVRVFTQGY